MLSKQKNTNILTTFKGKKRHLINSELFGFSDPLIDLVKGKVSGIPDKFRLRGGYYWTVSDGYSKFKEPLNPAFSASFINENTVHIKANKDLFKFNPGIPLEKRKDYNPEFWYSFIKNNITTSITQSN